MFLIVFDIFDIVSLHCSVHKMKIAVLSLPCAWFKL